MFKQAVIAIALFSILISVLLGIARGGAFVNCTLAESDLKRDTEFNWVSGKCVVLNKDGSRIYLNQIRGYGDGE